MEQKQRESAGSIDNWGRRLFKLRERKCRYESHLSFLNNCKNRRIIPNGFQIKWKLNLGNICDIHQDKVENILEQTSERLIDECIEVCKVQLQDIDDQLIRTENNIRKNFNDEILNQIYNSQNSDLQKIKDRIKVTKDKKLESLKHKQIGNINSNNVFEDRPQTPQNEKKKTICRYIKRWELFL